jgi:hypothetical protein
MKFTGKNRSTRGKTCPNATLSTTIPHGLNGDRTRASAVRGQLLTAWAMARPDHTVTRRNSKYTMRSLVLRVSIEQWAVIWALASYCDRTRERERGVVYRDAGNTQRYIHSTTRNDMEVADFHVRSLSIQKCVVPFINDEKSFHKRGHISNNYAVYACCVLLIGRYVLEGHSGLWI